MTLLHFNHLITFLKSLKIKISDECKYVLKEKHKDISLSTDKFLNKEITSFLQANSTFPILSEESIKQIDFYGHDDYFWILDPLDGTLNYFRSIPISCISIALWHSKKPIIGIIYNLNQEEIFVGVTETSELSDRIGAWLNDDSISVSEIQNKNQGIICTGFPSWRNYGTESILNFVKKVQAWKKVRLIGSAALSLAWVASGRTDAYMEEDIRIWDVAAGLTLVKAAGGEIYFKANKHPNFVTAIATNGKISVEELL